MNPAALPARLTARGYTQVSHGTTACPVEWRDLDGPAGTVRAVTYPGDAGRVEACIPGPHPARLPASGIRLSGNTPEAITVAMLNAAEAWLAGPAATP